MVGLSGGVDSSVAALLLQRQGHRIAGLFMKNWEEDDPDAPCPAEADARDAQAVAALLDIPFHARNFAAEYWDGVFERFLAELAAGRTPNPDVLCNREVKFKTFVEHAADLGYPRIATGHYARIAAGPEGWRLLKGRDRDKDQSYFLHALDQDQLAVACFPLGDLCKREVRALAAEAGLPTADKRDSTGICFIGKRDFAQFAARYLPARPGPITTPTGEVLGEHRGLAFYTIGQRDGLGIGGRRAGSGAPWYVAGKSLADDRLIVVQGSAHPALWARRVRTEPAHWIAGRPPARRFSASAKIRYRQEDQGCTVEVADDGSLAVAFDRPQRAVTPGQSLVLYQDELCLGGAVIRASDAPLEARGEPNG